MTVLTTYAAPAPAGSDRTGTSMERPGGGADVLPQDSQTSIAFGITINLKGQLIPIMAGDIANAVTKGVDLKLPGPVTLGSFNDFSTWFYNEFGIQIPSASELPPPLDAIIGKLTSLEVTVTQAHVHVYGKGDPTPTAYTLEMTAAWPASEGGIVIVKGLSIDGAVFGISNERATNSQS